MKPGSLRKDIDRNPSLLYFVPLGYQEPRYFEETPAEGENKPGEIRNTIWWSPDVAISGGSAMLEFGSAAPGAKPGSAGTLGSTGTTDEAPYLVRIEGLSADGRPFSYRGTIAP